MAMKLPRATIEELDGLVEQLGKPDAALRDEALKRLNDYERTGRIPLEVLLEFCESENPSLSMYAISALGRNGEVGAVKKLIELAERHRAGNLMFLEHIVDALGDTRNAGAAPVLLSLLGLRMGRVGKLFGRRGRKAEPDEPSEGIPEQLALPVLRALERVAEPKAARLLGDYLEHPDPLVRWHVIQNLVRCNVPDFMEQLKRMASEDSSDLVREAAELATERLKPLPPNLNN